MTAVIQPIFHSYFINFLPPVQISTLFHSPINAILSIFLEICSFLQCLRTAHSGPGDSSPKLLCNCSPSQKGSDWPWWARVPLCPWGTTRAAPHCSHCSCSPQPPQILTVVVTPWSHMRGHLESSGPMPRSTWMLCAALLIQGSRACSELHEEGEEKGFRASFLFPYWFFKSCNSVMNIHFNVVLKTQLDDISERKWSRNKRN